MIIYEHVWTIRMTRLLMSLMDATGEKSQMSLVVLQLDFYRLLPCRAATCVMHWQRKRSEFHPWCTPPEYQRNPFVALGPSSACTSHLWSMIHLSGPWSRRIWGRNLQPATPQIAARRRPPELNWNLYLWATWPHQNLQKNGASHGHESIIRMIHQNAIYSFTTINPYTSPKMADHWCINPVGAHRQGTRWCHCRRCHPAGIANAEKTAAEVKHLGTNVFLDPHFKKKKLEKCSPVEVYKRRQYNLV